MGASLPSSRLGPQAGRSLTDRLRIARELPTTVCSQKHIMWEPRRLPGRERTHEAGCDDAVHLALDGPVADQHAPALRSQPRSALRALAWPAGLALEERESGGGLELAEVAPRAPVRHAH